jgi:hypothetical protein
MSIAKSIYPGNWVAPLSSYQNQPVIALPGRVYYHRVGYVKVTSVGATSFDVIIPSPDKRPDDKPRADITGLVIPQNAYLYHVGLRILDARKDRSKGTARSGLTWSNGADRIKLASAVTVGTTAGAITATTASTPPLDDASLTIAPSGAAGSVFQVITPVLITQSGGLTLKLYLDNGSTGSLAAGAGTLSSTEIDGSFLIAEAAFYTEDGVSDESVFGGLPNPTQSSGA